MPGPQDKAQAAASTTPEPGPLDRFEAFRSALDAGPLGVWAWDLRSNRMTWSSHIPDFHGLPENKLDGTLAVVPTDLPAQESTGLFAAIRKTLETNAPYRLEYRLPGPAGRGERWFEASATVIQEDGTPVQLLGMCRDVTERLRINREVLVRARQQETLARMGERALTESDLQKFFNEVVATIRDILDVEMVTILELMPGDAELLLRAGTGWKAGVVGTATVPTSRESKAGYTLASGRPVITENLQKESRFLGDTLLHEHGVMSGITAPIAGRDGRAYGVLGAHSAKQRKFHDYDAAFVAAVANVVAGAIQRRQLDQRHELMIRELRHRSGNLFSQLLALFSQTAKNSRSVSDLVIKYEARVLALANAHRLITEGGWKSTSLNELLNTLLAAFLDRISFSGPNVFLEPDPTFGLSMAVHELVTNASKHGSLSEPAGRVDLKWSVIRTEQGLTLVLDWKESGGPAPKRSRRPGFGSRLINMVIERQLNGKAEQSFDVKGLEAKLTVPLTHERWPGGGTRASAHADPF
ncbi:MAG: GAF domain-containing protein [Alphaproteobacteria bacterium]|nr:MAG: GAF domain-containing protein [Alphaproteobacteria bacterium]